MADCAGENWLLALGVNIVCNGLVGMFLWLLKCRVIFSFSQDLLLKIFFFLFKHLLRKSITYKIGWGLFVVVYFAAQVFWNIWWKLKSYRGCKWIVIFLSLPLSICKVSFKKVIVAKHHFRLNFKLFVVLKKKLRQSCITVIPSARGCLLGPLSTLLCYSSSLVKFYSGKIPSM